MEKLNAILAALESGRLTQSALAHEAGLTQGAVSDIATGRTKNPGVFTVDTLHAAMLRLRPELSDALGRDGDSRSSRFDASKPATQCLESTPISASTPRKIMRRVELPPASASPGGGKAELWYGEFSELRPTTGGHGSMVIRLVLAFGEFLEMHPDVEPASEGVGFLLRRNPDLMLCPDFAIYRPEGTDPTKFVVAVPFLAVEVLSDSNTVSQILRMTRAFLDAGTEQFWIIDSGNRLLTVLRKEGDPVEYRTGVLRGDGSLDGLEIDLDKLFSRVRP